MDGSYKIFILPIVVFVSWLFVAPHACTDKSGAIKTLENQGYTDIQITGYRWFMSGRDDVYSTGFKARSPNGKDVSGAVTSGIFKGSTIRFD